MPFLACPTCEGQFRSDASSGSKVACPHCGQKIRIPFVVKPAASNKTVVGEVLDITATPRAPAPAEDVDEKPIEIEDKRDWNRVAAAIFLGFSGCLVLGAIIFSESRRGRGTSPAAKEYRDALRHFVKEARVLHNLGGLNPNIREYSDQLGKAQTALARLPPLPPSMSKLDAQARDLLRTLRASEALLVKGIREPIPAVATIWFDGFRSELANAAPVLASLEAAVKD